MIGIFEEQEKEIISKFESKFGNEIKVFNDLLKVHEAFIQATSNKIKDNDYPKWTILLLLSQVLPLMNNAFQLLASGYLRSSESLIRICGEAIILSVYFKEFPVAEEDYRTMHYSDFFHKYRIEKMLKNVEKSGKCFFKAKTDKKKNLYKVMFVNIYKEAGKFLHNNPNLIYDISKNQIPVKGQEEYLIIGPQLYPNDVLSMGLRRLFNTVIVSIVTLGISLDIVADDKELKTLKEANRIADTLNKGK